ncbi:hypothetical protein DFP88_1119 [Pseudoroseicyclus aestuarii]|uniref:Uncharacterized protein n=1 Tax=Pseudoroseicyclus aestuarii TaxID=1795041 RepID=A0A318SRQ7_9RHOB|nr:hypothetical protein DFP88_1119 [Pseudoroseicyclus aestuarii]
MIWSITARSGYVGLLGDPRVDFNETTGFHIGSLNVITRG